MPRRLILDAPLRRHPAQEALAFAKTRDIDRWIGRWLATYEQALADRALVG
jgi:hypothetical protein